MVKHCLYAMVKHCLYAMVKHCVYVMVKHCLYVMVSIVSPSDRLRSRRRVIVCFRKNVGKLGATQLSTMGYPARFSPGAAGEAESVLAE
jgi:hypothetical protein